MKIYFDMDGTLADFYSVDDWLSKIIGEDASPYRDARPLHNFSKLARLIHKCQNKGIEFAIISWGCKNSSEDFLSEVTAAKKKWLRQHLPSVKFSEVIVVDYGTPKSNFNQGHFNLLFDDEVENRKNWNGASFSPEFILPILEILGKN